MYQFSFSVTNLTTRTSPQPVQVYCQVSISYSATTAMASLGFSCESEAVIAYMLTPTAIPHRYSASVSFHQNAPKLAHRYGTTSTPSTHVDRLAETGRTTVRKAKTGKNGVIFACSELGKRFVSHATSRRSLRSRWTARWREASHLCISSARTRICVPPTTS